MPAVATAEKPAEKTEERPKRPPPPKQNYFQKQWKELHTAPWWVKFRLIFNTYRKLCTIVAIFNALAIYFTSIGKFGYAYTHPGAFIVGNLCVSVLVRNECFLRSLFLICNTLFAKWTPIWWRTGISSLLQHLGGIHSGCATSGLAWMIWRTVQLVQLSGWSGPAVNAFGIITCTTLGITFFAGWPVVRNRAHNVFERWHRFLGWTSLLMTWVFSMIATQFNTETRQWEYNPIAVPEAQEFWFVIGMTVWIVLPWTMTRRVPVEIEIPKKRTTAVIKFRRGMQQGLLGRISHSAVWEYHLFGLISVSPKADCHYMICGIQGDFTRSLVERNPKYLWTRELKIPHVSNTSKLYHKGIRVCTGTGIGSGLSTCMQSPNWFLIWIGSDFRNTFGDTIVDLMEQNVGEERRIIWDSKQRKARPNVVQLIKEAYDSWGAEVVFITSNYQGNMEMMEGCKRLGMPCYGTLWDF
ncbi:hypothetical protein CALCODRAFT_469659 [Calocera cornea HHB12733]|uniref:Non-ribosomal peptide synthetase n=1 Tax=Calocera cornea HHB12733 TaxID=1353952 RepID=A0A165G0Q9_9BASI|nr:hypothetical protein CALCODRAFT_469659 [Calocera cornea HHB12733]